MNNIEFISKDGIHFELYINGERQEEIIELVIRGAVNEAVTIEISRYAINPLRKR